MPHATSLTLVSNPHARAHHLTVSWTLRSCICSLEQCRSPSHRPPHLLCILISMRAIGKCSSMRSAGVESRPSAFPIAQAASRRPVLKVARADLRGASSIIASHSIEGSSCASRRSVAAMATSAADPVTFVLPDRSLMVTSITATTVEAFLAEMDQASTTGVDVLELRLDFIKDYDTERDLRRIMKASKLPYIVTYRPTWEW